MCLTYTAHYRCTYLQGGCAEQVREHTGKYTCNCPFPKPIWSIKGRAASSDASLYVLQHLSSSFTFRNPYFCWFWWGDLPRTGTLTEDLEKCKGKRVSQLVMTLPADWYGKILSICHKTSGLWNLGAICSSKRRCRSRKSEKQKKCPCPILLKVSVLVSSSLMWG